MSHLKLDGMVIRAAGFDLDGVLLDTEDLGDLACFEACRHFGIPYVVTRGEFWGMNNSYIYQTIVARHGLGRARSIGELVEKKRELYIGKVKNAKPIKDAVLFVRTLNELGIPLVLATSASQRSMDASLEVLGLEQSLFLATVPATSLPPDCSKPNKFHWEEAIWFSGVSADHFMGIEDSTKGMKSLVGSGALAVGITTSYSAEELREAGADLVVHSYRELANMLSVEY